MQYFASFLDRDFNAISTDGYGQHPVKSFSLSRRAFGFDDFTVSFKKESNTSNAVYIALYDMSGICKYVSLCGIPKTSKEITTVSSFDTRHIFQQTMKVSTVSLSKTEGKVLLKDLMAYILALPKNQLTLGMEYDIDVSLVPDTAKVDDFVEETGSLWDIVSRYDQTQGYVTIMTYDPKPDTDKKHLTVRQLPEDKIATIKISDLLESASGYVSYSTNMARVYYNDTLYKTYHLLSNNDIAEESELSDVYHESSSFGTYTDTNGTKSNQYEGKTKSNFLIYPAIDNDIYIDNDDSTKETEKKAEGVNKALELLIGKRYKDSLDINIDSSFSSHVFEPFFYDYANSKEAESYYPLTFVGKIYGYMKSYNSATGDQEDYYKVLPLEEVKYVYSSDGKVAKSVTFGCLSGYEWLEGI